MKHSPRRWRWIRGTGTLLSVTVAGLYILSCFRTIYGDTRNGIWDLTNGTFGLLWEKGDMRFWPDGPAQDVGPCKGPVAWWFGCRTTTATMPPTTALEIPLWAPLLLLCGPTIYAWRRCNRPPPGHCQKCGYDLAGIAAGVCPECGTREVQRRGAGGDG